MTQPRPQPVPGDRLGTSHEWWPDALVGLAVLVVGVVTTGWLGSGGGYALALLVPAMAVAAALHRRAPGAALALVWAASLLQLLGGVQLSLAQLAALVVAYGCARHGSVVTVWASAVSIPAGAVLAVLALAQTVYTGATVGLVRAVRPTAYASPSLVVAGVIAVGALIGLPWAVGLTLRLRGTAQRDQEQRVVAEEQRSVAEGERRQAEEIARLREEQTRLARDVHDVVGHSLAVILAQAESAQFRPETDTAAIRTTLANIAVSARQSLRDVRDVLSSTDGTASVATTRDGGLDALLDGVRAAGNDVRPAVVGTPRPLPPELEQVAFRVLQEMLTNALKHGRRGEPVLVERHWEGELRLEVRNVVAAPSDAGWQPPGARAAPVTDDTLPITAVPGPDTPEPPAGRGLEGMRQRLEAVGGRLDVRRREEGGVGTFTATAWVPLRGGAR